MVPPAERVLFVCTHNSARSQMAEGLLRHFGGAKFEVASAGTMPGSVRPEAVAVLAELGIDIADHYAKGLESVRDQTFDLVITVCDQAREACPFFPGARRQLHWSIDDPAAVEGPQETRLAAFRRARDELRRRIELELLSAPGSCQG